MNRARLTSVAVAILSLVGARPAWGADGAPTNESVRDVTSADARTASPILGYTYGAWGVGRHVVGAQGYGIGTAESRARAQIGGGVTAWGAPIERLTLIADASRDITGPFTPSFAGLVRIVGQGHDGFALAALGKFKVDGFAEGPNKEIESEVEAGALLSFARGGFHADLNAITGVGLGEEGEVDTEGRARVGYDLGDHVRVGADGQARVRVAGENRLPGGRTWDATGGPQLVVAARPVFGALTVGPTSVGTVASFGWSAMLTVGGGSF